jgi:hypothetical protein
MPLSSCFAHVPAGEHTRVPVPDSEEIASILSAYDALIEDNSRRIKIVKNIADTIFKGARNHSGRVWNTYLPYWQQSSGGSC